jgi:polyhydroxybutyrate depolymerase
MHSRPFVLRQQLLFAALAGCFLPIQAQQPSPATTFRNTLDIGSRTRSYLVHVPPNPPTTKKMALVLAFHGGGDSATGMEKLTRFDDLADREQFLVVYPEAVGHHWNDGRAADRLKSQREGVDDVAFVEALLREVSTHYSIDPARVFATGFSNGAIFCHYLAAHLADKVTAIAPVSGGIAEPVAQDDFKPARAVSVFIIHGTQDPLVPFGGGAVDHGSNGRVISTSETLRLWIILDACNPTPLTDNLPDADPADKCTVQWSRWSGGRRGTEVVLFRIEGGGHTWPGGRQYLPIFLIGRVCRDFDASQAIWEFFRQHPRRS